MNKFEKRRLELQEKLKADLARLEEEERVEARKVVVPMAGKFSALMSEEVEKFGFDNVEAIGNYKFQKAALRKKIREFIEAEFGASEGDNKAPEVTSV